MEHKIEAIIAQNLIELRKSRNLKQAELSEAIGYSDKTISRWENGTSVPDISTLVSLAEFYGVTVEDLIRENAAQKAEEAEKQREEENKKGKFSPPAYCVLSVLTVWLLSALVYVGTVMFQDMYLWQSFVVAIPLSTLIVYVYGRKNFRSKWLNFSMMTATILSGLSAIYFCLINFYNFAPLFILFVPLEGIVVIFTLFNQNGKNPRK